MAHIEIHEEVTLGEVGVGNWVLCFQWGTYHYDDDPSEDGYRFIWRRPDGSLQPSRGQARIPSARDLSELLRLATQDAGYIDLEV